MKRIAVIVFLLVAVGAHAPAYAASATFSWMPNPEQDLGGYKIHCGPAPSTYTITADVGKPALVEGRVVGGVSGLAESSTYYCAASAYDVGGESSGYSNEVSFEIGNLPPGAPGELRYEVNFSGVVTLTPIK